jgi:hypothetical protein
MSKVRKLELRISLENLTKLINTIKDLSNIDDKIVFKIDNNNILLYTLVGEGKSINAFKSFIHPMSIFDNSVSIDGTIIYIASSGKLLVKNMRTLLDFDSSVDIIFHYDDFGGGLFADKMELKSTNKLKLNFYGSDPKSTNTQVTIGHIKDLGDINNAKFSFDLKDDDFTKIKKLASPDVEMNIFYMNTYERSGVYYVSLGENNWNLELDTVKYDMELTVAFPKKYFKTINIDNGIAKIYIFDSFLMVSSANSELLISMEVTV